MPFRNSSSGQYPVSHEQIRAGQPNASFPAYFESAQGYDWVVPTAPPQLDWASHYVEEGPPRQDGGAWVQTWIVRSFTPQQAAERTQARQRHQTQQVRAQRNHLLADSDWTQLADAPVNKAAWAAYRQALRDVPAQAKFPTQVEWPQPPASN